MILRAYGQVEDVPLAKTLASSVPSARTLPAAADRQRRLWLAVARHTVSTLGRTDPRRALRILDEVRH